MTLARELVRAHFAARGPLPDSALRAARLHFVDALGVGLAAAGSPVGAPYLAAGQQLAGAGPSTVFGQSGGAAAADAALVNGGLMHSLEFDDTHTGSIMHGSSVLAAAALAAGEAHGVSGAALVGAYARGWQALGYLGLASPGRFHARGFQATSVAGTIAAALIGAELGGFDEERALAAVGIALSQSSGVMEFLSNGSSVKSLHSGWAAHGGLLAALLAKAGMTGPETALEGRYGLFATFAGDPDAPARLRELLPSYGRRWLVEEAGFKFFPCCHYLHPFLEAAGLLADRGVKAADVASLRFLVPAGAAPVICEPWERALEPATGHAARWSLPITVAARLLEGKVDLATFEQPASAAVRALARRSLWEPLPDARFPERFEAVIECELASGRKETVRIDDVDGNHSRPPSADRVLAKFRANASRRLTTEGIDQVLQVLDAPLAQPSLASLSRGLRLLKPTS